MSYLLLAGVTSLLPVAPTVQTTAPEVTILSPAAGGELGVPPRLLRFAVRVKAKRDQWVPQALIFDVADDEKFTIMRGSVGVKIEPEQCDGKHEIRGELPFAQLPEGKYFVRVQVWRGGDRENSAVQHLFVKVRE